MFWPSFAFACAPVTAPLSVVRHAEHDGPAQVANAASTMLFVVVVPRSRELWRSTLYGTGKAERFQWMPSHAYPCAFAVNPRPATTSATTENDLIRRPSSMEF